MELSERKELILMSLIKYYLKTGEPVGSKSLIKITGLNLSSATLRNEMSDLCSLGLLEQPHTSAGRRPTSIGYELYIDKLVKNKTLPHDLSIIIDKMLSDAAKDPENLVSAAGQVFSDLIGLPVLMATVTRDETYIRRVEILPMGVRTVLILLITSDGLARSRICRSSFNLAPEVLSYFEKLVSVNIIGTELNRFNPAFLQSLVALCSDLSLFLMPLLSSIFEMVEDLQSKSVNVKGESNLMKCCDNEYEARALLGLLTRQDILFSILTDITDDISIVFGDQTCISELNSSSIVIAKYKLLDKDIGRIGVIGPVRMAYEQLIPSVVYFADRLGKVMTQAINDFDE